MEAIEEKTCASRRLRCRDVFLFSHPRTASNLLCRLLSDQPGWAQSSYHFADAFTFARKSFNWAPYEDITSEQRQEFENLLQKGLSKLEQARASAAEESMWSEPSASTAMLRQTLSSQRSNGARQCNPTFFPDDLLTSWLPVFIIRHPALVFESWYRAEIRVRPTDISDKSFAYFTTFRYSRELYDWFLSDEAASANQEDSFPTTRQSEPIVIDADDVIENRSLEKLCELCNMDPSLIKFKWEVTSPPDDPNLCPVYKSYLSGLWMSTSVDPSKSSQGIDMAVKQRQWSEEFGSEVADALTQLVERALPDYNYLTSKKI
ncbi:hypothetical protein K4F52_002322 [Lecanicillium sp. MT-2017a]|nr:hypothetical protein K4F52_002322 [Lecanicillium sp. MT-2017a]